MEREEYRKHFELEERFWWFRGRRDFLKAVLGSRLGPDPERRCLDIGCGAGFNLKALEPFGRPFGCDFSEDALFYCRQRGLPRLARGDARALPFRDGAFGLITLLDVLSHESIVDDVAVLREVLRILAPGGHLLLSDNALPLLASPHDRAYHVRERYRKKSLFPRLEKAGFTVVRTSYFNFFLFPVILTVRLTKRLLDRKAKGVASDVKPVPAAVNGFLYGILRLEARLAKCRALPIGSSLVCLARKD
jgi:SAM-dependent methyltransferase